MAIGTQGTVAGASHLRERVSARLAVLRPSAHTPLGRPSDDQLNGVRPTPLWSSVLSRAVHRVEELALLLVMLHFAVGTLGILLGW
jgi:hypothetical protein